MDDGGVVPDVTHRSDGVSRAKGVGRLPDRERALSFGSVAAGYERFRLGYPDEVVDRVLAHADGPARTALEIGAGTGKATRAFTARDVAVVATEPDADMLAQLREHVPDARPVQTTLEAVDPAEVGAPFDLVYAAAALHWTDPTTRWERVGSLLRPGGVFASFGGPTMLADEDLRARAARAVAGDIEDDDLPTPDWTDPEAPLRWPGTELVDSPLFTDVSQQVVPRRLWLPVDEVVGELSTISAYLVLAEARRRAALDRVRAVLPDVVEVWADVILHVARRTATV